MTRPDFIYADNAATTALDPDAFEAMKPFLTGEYGNPSQPYSFSRPAKEALRRAREDIASCIAASPDEIYFTSCGTESDNWAIKGVVSAAQGEHPARVVTSCIEHHAVLNTCAALEKAGCEVDRVGVDSAGLVDVGAFEAALLRSAAVASVMLANNEIGTIEDVRRLAELAHAHGAIFHTDAVQAVGHIPVDVSALGVDMLSASAHKFNAPKGVGFLYIRRGTKAAPFMDGGGQEGGMRGGTENVASIVAMAAALKKNVRDMDETSARLKSMEALFFRELDKAGLDYMRNGDERRIPGSISVSFRGAEGEMLLHRLDLMGICISTGSACDSRRTEVSHVIKAIGVPAPYAFGTVRVTFGRNNREEDGALVAQALTRVLKG